MKKRVLEKYCIGCGLCKSVGQANMEKNQDGYLAFGGDDLNDEVLKFANQYCPFSTKSVKKLGKDSVWGNSTNIVFGYSSDELVREMASSGGALTSLCMYLLKEGLVDAVAHIGTAENNQIETEVRISTCAEEVVRSCGSRYTISAPLAEVFDKTEKGKKYAIVAKPCDIAALANYIEDNADFEERFPYLLSFFCAGLPSKKANRALLRQLGTDEADCTKLVYRGEGWPGKTYAIRSDGSKNEMTYEKSWGAILGRDVHPVCRFCMDGIGERADIACGDAWYQNNDGTPSFEERKGRNVIISRNDKGRMLVEMAADAGYLTVEGSASDEYLRRVQAYQFTRRSCMKYKVLAHKLLCYRGPYDSIHDIDGLSKYATDDEKKKMFTGTIKRIIKRKI